MNELKDIREGFNTGYIIQQHRPEIFKIIESSTKDVELPFFDAFKKGGETFTKDKIKSLLLDNLPSNSLSSTKDNPDLDIEKDLDV